MILLKILLACVGFFTLAGLFALGVGFFLTRTKHAAPDSERISADIGGESMPMSFTLEEYEIIGVDLTHGVFTLRYRERSEQH